MYNPQLLLSIAAQVFLSLKLLMIWLKGHCTSYAAMTPREQDFEFIDRNSVGGLKRQVVHV